MLLAFPELSTVRLVFFSADAVHGSVCPVLCFRQSSTAPSVCFGSCKQLDSSFVCSFYTSTWEGAQVRR